MAENKNSFILYSDSKEVVEALTDEQAGKLLKHIFRYVNDENPVCDDQFVSLAFIPIKQSLKRDLKKWEGKQEQRIEAGKRSAEVRKRNANEAKRKSTTVNDRSISSTGNGNGNGNGNEVKEVIHTPTKVEEGEYYLTPKKNKLSGKRLETFKIFWEKFNYKSGRAEAAQAWLDITELKPSLCEKIYKAAEIESKNRATLIEKGSTPKMAQGWIKSRRWEDEASMNTNQTSNSII